MGRRTQVGWGALGVFAVLLTGCSQHVGKDAVAQQFDRRSRLASCGSVSLPIGTYALSGQPLRCLRTAHAASRGAEATMTSLTDEAEPVRDHIRVLADGRIEIFTDNTSISGGGPGWARRVTGCVNDGQIVQQICSPDAIPGRGTQPSPSPSTNHVEVDWTRSYSSLDQLAEKSTEIVEIEVVADPSPEIVWAASPGTEPAADSGAGADKATLLRATVVRSWAGTKKSGQQLTIHQMGTPASPFATTAEAAHLVPGRRYAVYLAPFWYERGHDIRRYIVVGSLGAFAPSGSTWARITSRDAVPQRVTSDQIRASVPAMDRGEPE
ncbi:hypothetical protein [Luteipulveratus mongoliensis]|uniref:Uncharacterized protein n=1 Tax=Luteipulveratus mongoliensis TaxID=571913 RepID=A0A0K1JF13_9MICO|nr:hypothetical protein [Luteipulveratus mongoliensis]AKU15190.1 hypothetical protein VV02_03805 [Luteipulveratus mongoliensis]